VVVGEISAIHAAATASRLILGKGCWRAPEPTTHGTGRTPQLGIGCPRGGSPASIEPLSGGTFMG